MLDSDAFTDAAAHHASFFRTSVQLIFGCAVMRAMYAGRISLRPMLDEAASASYELSEEEYARNEVEDTWVQALLAMLCAILQWLQPLLTPTNYDALVASLLEKARRPAHQNYYTCLFSLLLRHV